MSEHMNFLDEQIKHTKQDIKDFYKALARGVNPEQQVNDLRANIAACEKRLQSFQLLRASVAGD